MSKCISAPAVLGLGSRAEHVATTRHNLFLSPTRHTRHTLSQALTAHRLTQKNLAQSTTVLQPITRSYMQPESSAVSSRVSTEQKPEQHPLPSSQHGLHDHNPAVGLSAATDAGAETTIPADQLALDAALAASVQDGGDTHSSGQNRRLKKRDTPSPPAGSRIAEYEKSSTPPVKKREGPAFEVIKKHRSPNDKSSPIQELPNGQ